MASNPAIALWLQSTRPAGRVAELGPLGGYTFMKIQRTLAILWLATFIAALYYWLWMYLHKSAPAYDGIHAWLSLLCLFGIVACIFLFQGAKWARISMGIIAVIFAVGGFWDIWQFGWAGWMRTDKWADVATFVYSLATIALLFFRRYEPAA
jgi:hypothetical protein